MKTQQVVLVTSLLAGLALTEQRFVGFNGCPCAAGAKALGVVDADTESGNMAPVNVLGIMLVETGDAVDAGKEVESDADGCAVERGSGESNGIALDEALQAGEIIRIVRGI